MPPKARSPARRATPKSPTLPPAAEDGPGPDDWDGPRRERVSRYHQQVGYHLSRKLAHLIRARSATCTAPGCRRPAARCDLDHTVPWDQGGLMGSRLPLSSCLA